MESVCHSWGSKRSQDYAAHMPLYIWHKSLEYIDFWQLFSL
jgi:hypothetical protein